MLSRTLLILSIAHAIVSQEIEGPPVELFKPVSYTSTHFNGVVRVISALYGCSGSFLKSWTGTQPPVGTPAYVLTNGHCLADFRGINKGELLFDFRDPTQIITNDFSDREQSPTPLELETFSTNIVKFATMNLTDIAIVELAATAEEIYKKGYKFYDVINSTPIQGSLLMKVGFPGGFAMTSADSIVGENVSFLEAWGHEIEMAWSTDGGIYGGFSGSGEFDAANVVNCVVSHGYTRSGFCQRVDYINPCFSNGVFNFSRPDCFGAYKKRMYERFAVVLPGFTVPDNSTGGTAKFGDQSKAVITEVIKTDPEEAPANSSSQKVGVTSKLTFVGSILVVLSGMLAF